MSGFTRRAFIKSLGSGLLGTSAVAAGLAVGKTSYALEKPIKWGFLDCLSGTFGAFGKGNIGGTKLAIWEINEAGGILGRRVELVIEDTEANTEIAARKARKMILKDNVDVIQGSASTSTTTVIMQICGQQKMLHINSEFDSMSTLKAKNDYSFTIAPLCEETERARMAGIKKIYPANERKRWFIFYPDYSFGRDMRDMYVNELERWVPEAELIGMTAHPFGETDYSTHIAKILKAKPHIVISCSWAGDLVNFIKQAKPLGFFDKTHFVMSTASTSAIISLKEAMPEGLWVFTDQGDPYLPHMTDWRNKYVDYTGELPTAESVSAYYDAVYMYKAAVEKAGSTDTKKVAQALATIKYTGPSGKRDMKANHIADVEFMPFYKLGKVDEFEWLVPVKTEKIPYDQVKYTNAELIEHGCKWCKTI